MRTFPFSHHQNGFTYLFLNHCCALFFDQEGETSGVLSRVKKRLENNKRSFSSKERRSSKQGQGSPGSRDSTGVYMHAWRVCVFARP